MHLAGIFLGTQVSYPIKRFQRQRLADLVDPRFHIPLETQLAEQVRQTRRGLDLKPDKLVRFIPVNNLPKPTRKPRVPTPDWLTLAERKIWKRIVRKGIYTPFRSKK